jgi:hypothetical protein
MSGWETFLERISIPCKDNGNILEGYPQYPYRILQLCWKDIRNQTGEVLDPHGSFGKRRQVRARVQT